MSLTFSRELAAKLEKASREVKTWSVWEQNAICRQIGEAPLASAQTTLDDMACDRAR